MKLKNFTKSKNKVNYIYELTPRGIRAKAALTAQFLDKKKIEFDQLKAEIDRLELELNLSEKTMLEENKG